MPSLFDPVSLGALSLPNRVVMAPMTLEEFRGWVDGALVGNCGYTLETATAAVEQGRADAVAFGRPYISNPDLVERFRNGWPLAEDAPMDVWYSFDEHGYADWSSYREA